MQPAVSEIRVAKNKQRQQRQNTFTAALADSEGTSTGNFRGWFAKWGSSELWLEGKNWEFVGDYNATSGLPKAAL